MFFSGIRVSLLRRMACRSARWIRWDSNLELRRRLFRFVTIMLDMDAHTDYSHGWSFWEDCDGSASPGATSLRLETSELRYVARVDFFSAVLVRLRL